MLTMAHFSPLATSAGMAARQPLNVPVKLMSIVRAQLSSGASTTDPGSEIPAMLHRLVILPKRATVAATAASH